METIGTFIDEHSAIIGLVILAIMFIEFVRERYSPTVVSVLGACAYAVMGLIDEKTFFSVFSNSAPLTIAAMFVLSGALIRTGVINRVADIVMVRAKKRPKLAIAEVMIGALVASAFLNNTPVVVVLIPIIFRLAQVTGVPVKKLMMPLSIIAILGGCLTLIGTSTNLIVAGIAEEQGLARMGIFSIFPYGLAGAIVGMVALVALSFLLPSDPPAVGGDTDGAMQDYLSEIVIGADDPAIGQPASKLSVLSRSVKLVGVRRGSVVTRAKLDQYMLKAGDRLIVRADGAALLTLRENKRFELGIATSGTASSHNGEIIEAMISPSHPSIGRRLTEIPFLNRLKVRVLGVTRMRHFPGPDLANVRIRGADRVLVAGDDNALRALRENQNLMGVDISRQRAFRRQKAWIAIACMVAVVTLSALDVISIGFAAMIAIGVILVTRCIDAEEAWSTIDGDVLVLIFAMLAVGLALEQSGSVDLMVGWVTPLLQSASPVMLIFLVYFFAVILSELLSNNAVAALMTPIIISLANQLGTDPMPLVIALMIGASACFATPVGYQTNALVYAAGDYKFADFVRIGVPLDIIVGIAVCAAIAIAYG